MSPREIKTLLTPLGHRFQIRLMAEPWWWLADEEIAKAVKVAKREGERSVAWLFEGADGEEPGTVPLSQTLIAADEEFQGLSEEAIRTRIRIQAIPTVESYLDWFFESAPTIAEQFRRDIDPDDVTTDPRVAHFCVTSQRTLCRFLDLPQPPTEIAELEQMLAEAEEEQAQAGPRWNAAADVVLQEGSMEGRMIGETNPHDPIYALPLAILRRDLAQMMLNAALYDRYPERWRKRRTRAEKQLGK
jgi:hypothetical protein